MLMLQFLIGEKKIKMKRKPKKIESKEIREDTQGRSKMKRKYKRRLKRKQKVNDEKEIQEKGEEKVKRKPPCKNLRSEVKY